MKKHVYVGTIAEVCLKLEKDVNSFGRCTVADYIRDKEHEARVLKNAELNREKKIKELTKKFAIKSQVVSELKIDIDFLNGDIFFQKYLNKEAFSELKEYREKQTKLYEKYLIAKLEARKLEKELEVLINERN